MFLALNAVEAAALQKAKEERQKLSDTHKSPPKRQGDILERDHKESNRVSLFCNNDNIFNEVHNVSNNGYFTHACAGQ